MAHPLTGPAVGALVVAAAAFGVHLGESAIADINPIHFQGPAVHPRDRGAAIEPIPTDTQRPVFASAYGWDEGAAARARECIGCGEVYADEARWEPAVTYYSEAPEEFAAPAYSDRAPEPDPYLSPRRIEFERYAYYPIEVEAVAVAEEKVAQAQAQPDFEIPAQGGGGAVGAELAYHMDSGL